MLITDIPYKIDTSILFFGHIHRSRIFEGEEIDKKNQVEFTFGKELQLSNERYWVNVGPIWVDRVWCLYNSTTKTITFMKTSE